MIFRSNFFRRLSEGESTGSTKRGKASRAGRTRQRLSRRADFRRLLERDLRFESLEARRVLAVAAMLDGDDNAVITGSAAAETITLTVDSGRLVVIDTGGATAGAGFTQDDANTISIDVANILGGNVFVDTGGGDDSIEITDFVAALSVHVDGPASYALNVTNTSIDGAVAGGLRASNFGSATIFDSEFSNNFGTGIELVDGGSVSIDSVSAFSNDGAGLDVSSVGEVELTESLFAFNFGDGIRLHDTGAITLSSVGGAGNGGDGLNILDGGSGITIADSGFNSNDGDGISITDSGDVTFDDQFFWTASNNEGNGLNFSNVGAVHFGNAVISGNWLDGVRIADATSISVSFFFDVLASGDHGVYLTGIGSVVFDDLFLNSGYGDALRIEDSGEVTILNSTVGFSPLSNDGSGIRLKNIDNVVIDNVLVRGNQIAGLNIETIGTLSITELELTGNVSAGSISDVAELNFTGSIGAVADAFVIGSSLQHTRDPLGVPVTNQAIDLVDISEVNLFGGDGEDTFTVVQAGLPATGTLNLFGGDPTTLPGDRLIYDGNGTNTVLGLGIGTISAAGFQDVVYSGMEQVQAGTGFELGSVIDLTQIPGGEDGEPNQLTARLDPSGTLLQLFFDPDGPGPAAEVLVLNQPITSVDGLTIQGTSDDDTLIVDFANGSPVPSGGIAFDGGNGFDALEIINYVGVDTLTVDHFLSPVGGPFSGSVQVGSMAPLITFADIEPLALAGDAADVVINLPSGMNPDVLIADDTDANFPGNGLDLANTSAVGGSTFEYTSFTNPTNSLTVNGGSSADTITLRAMDAAYAADTNINTGDGDDTVVILATTAGTLTAIDTQVGLPETVLIGVTPGNQNTGVGSLAGIAGDVTLSDSGGAGRFVFIDNSSDNADRDWTVSSSGPNSATVAISGITGTITYDTIVHEQVSLIGGDGDDQFTIDLSGGNIADPLPYTNLNLFGGGQGAGGDSLVLIDTVNVHATVTHLFTNANDGEVIFNAQTPNNDSIRYFGLEPILDNLTVTNRVFTFLTPGIAGTLEQSPGGLGATHTRIDSAASELVDFTTPTNSLVINLATGSANTFAVNSLSDDFNTPTNTINLGANGDTVNFERSNAGANGWTVVGGAGNDTVNLSPTARDLDLLAGRVFFQGGGGANDTLNVFDDNQPIGDTFTVTSTTIDRVFWDGGATYDAAVEFINLVTTGDGGDTINVNSTSATATTTIDANSGNDTFNILASELGGTNIFRGGTGNDTFNLSVGAAGITAPVSISGGANNAGGGRDTVRISDIGFGANAATPITITYTGAVGGTGMTVAGLGETVTIDTVETVAWVGGGGNDDVVTVVGTSAADDLITVAPIDGDRALVFNNSPLDASGPFNAPPEDFATRIPGVSGGSVRPDLDLSGLANLTGLTITDPGPGTGDRLYIYGESTLGLNDGNAFDPFGFGPGQILPAVGEPAAFDVITVSDTQTTVDGHVAVNYNSTDFIQADPATQAAVVINAGDEGNPPMTPGVDVADDITLVRSGTYRFQVNGGDPDPDSTGIVPPDGDRLFVPTSGDLSVFSDKAFPPNVSVIDASGNLPFGFSSIETLVLDAQGGTVNLLGDNNFTQDQTDNFVVRGTGPNAFTLEINGSAPIQFVNVTYLNVIGGEEIDTLDIMAWADNTTQGWGIQVFFDEGAPDQTDGGQEDLLIYNTVGANPVSENIVIQPSGPESGELRVTNAVDGSVIVIISYINNLDIIVNDNDGFLSDTDTLTLRGTNPDPGTPNAPSGMEDFIADFSAAGDVANPMVTVVDTASGLMLYRLRDFTNFNSINIEPLGGSDYVEITGRDDGSLTVNVDNGNPTGTGDAFDVDTIVVNGTTGGSDTFTFSPGADPDSGRLEVTRAGALGTTVVNFSGTERLVIDGGGGGGVDILNVNGTAAANLFTVNPTSALNGTVSVDASPLVSYQNFGFFGAVLNFNGGGNGDAFRLTGTPGPDRYTYSPMASDSAVLFLDDGFDGAQFNLNGFDSALLDAGDSFDTLEVFVNNAMITPGNTSDSGKITATTFGGQGLLPLEYVSVESVAALGGTVVVNGTEGDDIITVQDNGLVTIANQDGVVLNSYDLAFASSVIINALGGNDTFFVDAGVPFMGGLTVMGGGFGSGSNTLNLFGALGVAEDVNIIPNGGNPTEQLIFGLGGLITVSGIDMITYTGDGNDDNLTVQTGLANHTTRLNGRIFFDELTSSSLPDIRFSGVDEFRLVSDIALDTVTINPTFLNGSNNYFIDASVSDTVVFEGAGDDDRWTLTNSGGGGSLTLTDNSLGHSGAAVTVLGTPQDIILNTLGGDDVVTIDVSVGGPIPLPLTFNGGAGSDTLLIIGTPPAGDFDSVTYSPGPTVDAGRLEYVLGGNAAMRIDFTSLEPVIDATPAANLIVNGTNADNSINYTQGSIAAHGLVSVDGFETIEFTNKTNLVINGLSGSDTINLNNPNTPTGLAGIFVNGGDPSAGDTLIVNGTAGADDITYRPAGFDSGLVLVAGAAPVIFTGTEHLTINGLGGGDSLTIDTVPIDGTQVLTPGTAFDSGRVDFRDGAFVTNNAVSLDFRGLGMGGSLTFADIGRFDDLIYRGTDTDDTFTVTTGGQVLLNGQIPVNTPSIINLTLAGLDGNDTFNIAGDHNLPGIVVQGGNPSAGDVLNFTGSGAGEVTVDLATLTVTEAGFGPVTFSGVEQVNVNAGGANLTVLGTAGDDELSYSPTGVAAGTLTLSGLNSVFNLSDVATLVLDPLAGTDLVTVHGNSAANTVSVARGATTTVQVDATLPINLTAATEALVVAAGLGNDTITVSGSGGPASLTIDGGLPTTGDTLIVDTTFNLTTTVVPGSTPDSGVISNTDGNVSFIGIEGITINGQAGAGDALVILGTHDDDTFALQRTGGANRVWLNDRAVVTFNDQFETVTLNGRFGSDTFSVHSASLVGVTTVNVIGGDPTASDTVIVNGTAGQNTVNVTPTAIDAATITGLGPVVNVTSTEHLIYSGLGGNDLLTITATVNDDTIVHTPGETADAGRLRVNSLLALDYMDLGVAGSVTVDGNDGDDTLVYRSSNHTGDFTVAANGDVTYEDSFVHVVVSTANTENLMLDASSGGTSLFTLNGGYDYDTVTLIGSNHSESMGDVAQLNGDGTPLTITSTTVNDEVLVTGGGLAAVTLFGIENLVANAAGGDVTFNGNSDPNAVTVRPLSADSAKIDQAGLDLQIDIVEAGGLLVDLLGGSNSLTVLGTQGDDAIVVTGTQVAVNALLPVDYAGVESLSVLGQDGSDTFFVTPSAQTSFFIDGGNPIGTTGDRLVLTSLSGTAFVAGPQPDQGGFNFADELPVSFDGIEAIDVDLDGNEFTFLGTHGDDVITVVGTDTDAYTISINAGPAVAFSNSGDLSIDSLSGDDRIVIDVNELALGGVSVEGGQPQTSGDRLTVSGTDASWTPSTGTLVVDAQLITVSGIETLSFDGENANGSLAVVGSGAAEVFRHTPGAALDAGHVAVTATGNGMTQLGIGYSGLGLGGTVTIEGAGGIDTLLVEGTQSSEVFQVAPGTGTVTLSDSMGTRVPLLQTDIGILALDGLNGDDFFILSADLPYNGVQVLGGNAGGSNILQINDVAGSADTFVVNPSLAQGLGSVNVNAVPIAYAGIGQLLLIASFDDGDSLTINDDLADNTWTVKGGPILGDRVQIDGRETIDYVAFDTVELVNNFGSDVFHIHPTDLIGFNTSLTVTGDGDDALVIHGTTANDTLASVPGGGAQGTATANGVDVLFGGLASVELRGGDGDDVFDVTPIVGVNTLVTGGAQSASDQLNVTVPDDVRTTQGAISTSGRVDQTGAGPIDYTGVESMSITSLAGGTLTSRATHDNDTIALQFLGGANRIWINDGTVTAFSNFDVVTLQGLFGNDTFSIHPTGLVGVTTVNVEGGDPTASDTLIVNGSADADDITYRPATFDSGSVAIAGAATVNFTTTEHLTINGLGGGDSLTIDTFEIDGTQVLTPGSTFDSGRVDFRDGGFATNRAVPLDFLGLEVGGSLTFADVGRFDDLIYRGTDTDDTFTVTSGGQVLLNSQLPVNTPSIVNLILAGLDGDDTFEIAGDHNLPRIVVEGGSPADGDVLNFIASGSGEVTTDFGNATVSEAGFGPVSYTGLERIHLDAGGLGVAFVATDEDDDVTVTVLGASSGTVQIGSTAQQGGQAQQPPTAPLVHYTNTGGNAVDIDLGDGQDTLIVVGNALSQAFVVDGVAQTVTIDDNDNGSNDGIVTYQNAESLAVYGLEGSDTFTVTGGPIPIFIDGGDPIGAIPGDTLILTNAFAFFAGPESDEGGFLTLGGPEGIVSFDHIESIIVAPEAADACPFVIFGTNGDDDITVIARDGSTHAGADGVQDFTVSINSGIEMLFLNQPALVIDALAGDDDIVIRGPAPNQAAWDMQLTIIGGPASAITGDQGDVLAIETPGMVDVVYTPTGSDTGLLAITNTNGVVANITIQNTPYIPGPDCPPLPPPLIGGNGGIETLIYDGEGFGDSLTILGTLEADTIVHSPGAGIDEGSVRVNTLLAMQYQNLGLGELIIDGDDGDDTLVVDGTGLSDSFTVAANTGAVTLANSHGTRLAIQQLNLEALVLNGLEGDDTFTIESPQPYNSITVNGGGPGASDVLTVLGDAGTDEAFIVNPGFNPGTGSVLVDALSIPFTGVEHVLLRGNGGDNDSLVVNDDLADNVWTVNAGPTFGDRIQIDQRESIDYDGFATLTLVNNFGSDQFIIHPTHLIGTDSLTVIGAGGVRDDVATLIATEADDVVTSTSDTITINDAVPITIGNNGAGFAEVQVLALGGDDHITLSLDLPGVRKFVDGGAGNDFIDMSGTLDAVIFGGDGDDFIIGSPVADFIDGGRGNDIIFGNGGNNIIYGGEGNDILIGGTGSDQLFGGAGDDTFIWNPGDGSDVIDGGTGNNRLQFAGGAGADAFVLAANGTRLRLSRQPGNVVMDVANVQQVDTNVSLSFTGLLSGAEEVPPVATAASGRSFLTYNSASNTFDIDLFIQGITPADLTGAHIHVGAAGVNGPVIFNLGTADWYLDGGGLRRRISGATFPEANIADLLAGNTYVNIHTVANPGGEIRTQLNPLAAGQGLGGADTFEIFDLHQTDVRVVNLGLGINNGGLADGAADDVRVHGRTTADHLLITSRPNPAGPGFADLVNVAGLRYDVNLSNAIAADGDRLTVLGNEGDDFIHAVFGVEETILITLDGGAGNDHLIANGTLIGGPGDDLLVGGPGDNLFFGGDGDDTFIGGGGNNTYDGGAGFDTILVEGTPGADLIDVFQTADDALTYSVNGVTHNETLVVGTVEEVRVEAGAGADLIRVRTADALFDQVGTALRMTVNGGTATGAGDRLVVIDDGTDDLTLYRKGFVPTEGTVEIGPGNPQPFLIVFSGIERVQFLDENGMTINQDAATGPRLAVFHPDPYEYNDDRLVATHLGAAQTINLVANIDPGPILDPFADGQDIPGDQDWYRFVAEVTGTLDVQVYFTQIGPLASGRPGLPADGNLDIEVLDAAGNVISGFGVNDATDNERRRIPAVAGQTYYLRVIGNNNAINAYNVTVLNVAPPVPFDIELQDTPVGDPPPANSDTGRSQFDNVTRDNTPTIYLRLDDGSFRFDVQGNDPGAGGFPNNPPINTIPIPFQTLQQPGYRVAIFDEGPTPGQPATNPQIPVGFAEEVVGSPGLYRFTFPVALSDGSHFISARVQMVDPSAPQQTGFGARSASLEIIVDTVPPPVHFGLPGVANDGLHPDSDSGVVGNTATFTDRITNDTTPTFWGTAEANSIVRAYIDVNGNGIVDNQDILIGFTVALPFDGTNQFPAGRWELTSTVDMNSTQARNLAGGLSPLPEDGLRRILVTAEDVAGNVSDAESLNIFIDTQGPQVTNVFITGEPGFNLFLGKFTEPDTIAPTPLVHSLSISVQDLPARITEFLYTALDVNVALNPGHYMVRGDFNGIIPIESVEFISDPLVNGQPASGTIVLNFFEPLPDDRFTLTISDALVDPAGNALDGETNAVEPHAIPSFPSGDGQPGGDFVARFTVDSRPELGVWAAGSVWVDTNGNFTFDPDNADFVNRDITYVMGFTSDHIFAGNFRNAGPDGIAGTADDGAADGFDKLAAYGKVGTQFRWLVDTDNDGVSDPPRGIVDPAAVNGLPVAGNFNPAIPGDQVGLFDGTRWHLDTTGNYNVNEVVTIPGMVGYPIVGDFNGDGLVDLGTWADDTFHISLAGTPGGVGSLGWSTTLISFRFGFIGVRERPVAADMDQDGFTDLGLWVPDRSGVNPSGGGEWYFLISGGESVLDRIVNDAAGAPFIPFTPVPFGNDLYREFGNEFALPVVGNFDPPPGRGEANVVGEAPNQLDVDGNGVVEPLDALIVLNYISRHGNGAPAPLTSTPPFLDVNRDGVITPIDALLVLNHLSQSSTQSLLAGEGESTGRWQTSAAPLPTLPAVEDSERDFQFDPSDLESPADAWKADSAWDDLVDTLAESTRSGNRGGLPIGSPTEEEESDYEALVDSALLDFEAGGSAW